MARFWILEKVEQQHRRRLLLLPGQRNHWGCFFLRRDGGDGGDGDGGGDALERQQRPRSLTQAAAPLLLREVHVLLQIFFAGSARTLAHSPCVAVQVCKTLRHL